MNRTKLFSNSHLWKKIIKIFVWSLALYSAAAAQVWNGLPEAVVSSSSLQTFRRHLKTHLFQLSYPHLIFDRLTGIITVVRYLDHSKIIYIYLLYLLLGRDLNFDKNRQDVGGKHRSLHLEKNAKNQCWKWQICLF